MTTARMLPAGKGDRTRDRLLNIAIRQFAHSGFRVTSVSEIAREAQLTPAAVYAYFAGKDGLFVAAVDADAASLIDTAVRGTRGSNSFDRLVSTVTALIEGLAHHPLARRVLAGHEPDVIGRLLELPSLATLRTATSEELRSAQRCGEIRNDIKAHDLAIGIETIVLSLLLGIAQTGTPDASRMRGIRAIMKAILTVP